MAGLRDGELALDRPDKAAKVNPSSCSIDVAVPSTPGRRGGARPPPGRSPWWMAASAHIGITAPARANSGICLHHVAAVRNRWPLTRSPVCQSPPLAGRQADLAGGDPGRRTGRPAGPARAGTRRRGPAPPRRTGGRRPGRCTGARSRPRSGSRRTGRQQSVAQLRPRPCMRLRSRSPNDQAYWSTLPSPEWLRQNGAARRTASTARRAPGWCCRRTRRCRRRRTPVRQPSPAPIGMPTYGWSSDRLSPIQLGRVALDPGELRPGTARRCRSGIGRSPAVVPRPSAARTG